MLGPRKPWPVPAAALTPGSPRVGTRPLSWGSLLGPPAGAAYLAVLVPPGSTSPTPFWWPPKMASHGACRLGAPAALAAHCSRGPASLSGIGFHLPCWSLAAQRGHTKDEARAPWSGFPASAPIAPAVYRAPALCQAL